MSNLERLEQISKPAFTIIHYYCIIWGLLEFLHIQYYPGDNMSLQLKLVRDLTN